MKSVNLSVTDTPISGVSAPSVTIPVLNYDSDFRLKPSSSANEVILVNTKTSLDEDEQIRISATDISDIYKNAGISADLVSSTKEGYSLLIQLTKVVKETDSANVNYVAHLPFSAHIVLKIPKTESVTNENITTLVTRLMGALYETGSPKVIALLKGAISPKGL